MECPPCGEAGGFGVKTSVAEQSSSEDRPLSCRPKKGFVGARPAEILSFCVSAD